MVNENEKEKLIGQLKKALTWNSKYEDSSRKEIMIDESVLDQAEKISRMLDTNIERIFTLAAYRILKKERSALAPHHLIDALARARTRHIRAQRLL